MSERGAGAGMVLLMTTGGGGGGVSTTVGGGGGGGTSGTVSATGAGSAGFSSGGGGGAAAGFAAARTRSPRPRACSSIRTLRLLAVARRHDAILVDALRHEIGSDRVGALFAQYLVPLGIAGLVGVAVDSDGAARRHFAHFATAFSDVRPRALMFVDPDANVTVTPASLHPAVSPEEDWSSWALVSLPPDSGAATATPPPSTMPSATPVHRYHLV